MILDSLQEYQRYSATHVGFKRAFEFLRTADLRQQEDGQVEIEGTRVFAVFSAADGKGQERAMLESHRKYIDIQYVIEGTDRIGWLPTEQCGRIVDPYDSETDLVFYYDRPNTWLEVPTGYFAVFFPEDAHAPLAGSGKVRKVILKIAVT